MEAFAVLLYSFSLTQSRYSTFDRELLPIYLAIKYFRYFIEGRTFTVFTDHAPLCNAVFSRSQNSSPRQQRHLDLIVLFTSDVRYVKGEKNVVADCLSRKTASVIEENEAINFFEMAAVQQRDPIIDHIQTSKNLLKLEYRSLPNKVSILGDILTETFRSLVPEDFRRKAFDLFHSLSYFGIKGTQKLISRKYTWPGMKADVKQWCLSCVACQQSKIQRHPMSPLQGFVPISQKFQHIHVDIVSPLPSSCDHTYLLTIVDRFSRWFKALPLRDISAKSFADAFVLHFVARYGAPATLTADRGKQFTSGLWKDLAKFLGCELINTTSYNPKANGIVERYHLVLKASIKAQKQPSDWYSNLGRILPGLRTTMRNDMGFSPAEMLYSSSLRLPGEFLSPQKEQSLIENVQQL